MGQAAYGHVIAQAVTDFLNDAGIDWPSQDVLKPNAGLLLFERTHLIDPDLQSLGTTKAFVIDRSSDRAFLTRAKKQVTYEVGVIVMRRLSQEPAAQIAEGDEVKRFVSDICDALFILNIAETDPDLAAVRFKSATTGPHAIPEHLREHGVLTLSITLEFTESS